jgi:hypothetical protein
MHTVIKSEVDEGGRASSAVLTHQAEHSRSQAKRARRLASSILVLDVVENLKRYADELEALANDLDRRAATISLQEAGNS